MVINLNSLSCKNRIITYQNFKICILEAYAYAYKRTTIQETLAIPSSPRAAQILSVLCTHLTRVPVLLSRLEQWISAPPGTSHKTEVLITPIILSFSASLYAVLLPLQHRK